MFSFFNKANANYEQLAYEFNFKSIDGGENNLQQYLVMCCYYYFQKNDN